MAYTLRARPVYEATSLLRFEQEQVNLPQLVQQLSTENRISTEMEVLQGAGAADAVIDSLGLRAQLVSPRKGRVTQLFPVLRVAASADTGTLLFRADGDSGYAVWREGARPAKAVCGPIREPGTRSPGVTLALAQAALARRRTSGSGSSPWTMRCGASRGAQGLPPRPRRRSHRHALPRRDPELAARAANLLAAPPDLPAAVGAAVPDRGGGGLPELSSSTPCASSSTRRRTPSCTYRERTGAVDPAEQARTQVGRLTQIQADRGNLDAERMALGAPPGADPAGRRRLSRRPLALPQAHRLPHPVPQPGRGGAAQLPHRGGERTGGAAPAAHLARPRGPDAHRPGGRSGPPAPEHRGDLPAGAHQPGDRAGPGGAESSARS